MFEAVRGYFVRRFGGKEQCQPESGNLDGVQNGTLASAQISGGRDGSAPKIRAADVVLLRLLTDLA